MDINSKAIANNKEVILLTKEQQTNFAESLLNPELPNAKLQKSMKKYVEMENKKGYESYKSSGVDWIGDIPKHWEVRKLKYLAKIKNGMDYKHIETSEDGYPVMGSGGQFAYAEKYLFSGESVLLGRKGTIDKPNYVNGKYWIVDTSFYTKVFEGVKVFV